MFLNGQSETVFVTGGAGYIGSILVRRLLNTGYRVRVMDRLLYGDGAIRDVLNHPHLELVVADFGDRAALDRALVDVSAIFHLGAIVGDPACAINEEFTRRMNLDATRTIAEAAKSAGIRRMIFASTCSVYGASDEVLDERSALNPVSLYAESKIAAEQMLIGMQDETFSPVIMRFGTAYGDSYRPRFDLVVNLLTAKAVREGQVTVFGGDQWRPFVHVDDIARALLLAFEAPIEKVAGQTFNVGSNEQNHQLSEVGDLIQSVIPGTEVITNDLIVDKRNYYVQFDKIRDTLGFAPVHTLKSSIIEMRESLEYGVVEDYKDRRYNNNQYLREIIDDLLVEPLPFVVASAVREHMDHFSSPQAMTEPRGDSLRTISLPERSGIAADACL